jgi:hypothetical protein
MIQAILAYLVQLFEVIGYALWLDPRIYAEAIIHPQGLEIIMGIIFLSGMSMLLGQSVMLFVNQVRRGRFFFSLATNGLVFLASYVIWGTAVAFSAWLLFDVGEIRLVIVAFLVGISTAPMVFGFLILIPYMGPAIGKVLSVWQLLIMTTIVQFTFEVDFIPAAICVGLSWLLMLLLSNTIGKPVVRLRNFVYRKATGSSLDATMQDIVREYSSRPAFQSHTPTEGQP